jgi:hypothetical protein
VCVCVCIYIYIYIVNLCNMCDRVYICMLYILNQVSMEADSKALVAWARWMGRDGVKVMCVWEGGGGGGQGRWGQCVGAWVR